MFASLDPVLLEDTSNPRGRKATVAGLSARKPEKYFSHECLSAIWGVDLAYLERGRGICGGVYA